MRIILLACFLLLLSACDSSEMEQSQQVEQPTLAEPATAVGQFGKPVKLILDTDTANEIDDMYAIARLLGEEQIDLLGMTSAQWYHVLSGDSTVYRSQQLNEEMLTIADHMDLPHPMGADMIMGKPWGGMNLVKVLPLVLLLIKSKHCRKERNWW